MNVLRSSLVLTTVLAVAACAGGTAGPDRAEPAAQPAAGTVEVGPQLEVKLAGADAADGTVDHVVSLCPGCGLGMDGSHEHAVDVGDYALHFCSEDCKERFTENTEASLVALVVPDVDDRDDDADADTDAP